VRFLVDECLSPELAVHAREAGYPQSAHVTWLGLRARDDWSVARRAIDDGFVLVTNNAVDFRPLYGRTELHVGLICLNVAPGMMNRALQLRLFKLALEELDDREPWNQVVEVTASRNRAVVVARYELPGAT